MTTRNPLSPDPEFVRKAFRIIRANARQKRKAINRARYERSYKRGSK